MKGIKIFAVLSTAVVLTASIFSGCKDNNTATVKTEKAAITTTTIEIADWAIQEPSTIASITKKAQTSKTTSTKANKTNTTTKSGKNSSKTSETNTSALPS